MHIFCECIDVGILFFAVSKVCQLYKLPTFYFIKAKLDLKEKILSLRIYKKTTCLKEIKNGSLKCQFLKNQHRTKNDFYSGNKNQIIRCSSFVYYSGNLSYLCYIYSLEIR